MSSAASSLCRLRWFRGMILAAGAVFCFHAAYSSADFTPLRWSIAGYLVCLVQLGRLKTTRLSFYTGLGTGFLCVAPQIECFWRIFGPAAIPLWLILAFWTAAFVALAHVTLTRLGPLWAVVLLLVLLCSRRAKHPPASATEPDTTAAPQGTRVEPVSPQRSPLP